MKPTDNDIKKAFSRDTVPAPSETAKNKAIQGALDELSKKNAAREKKSQGFSLLLRRMGKTVQKIFTLKGEPIMTQRQFATVGIAVIAIGLFISLGPQVFHTTKVGTDSAGPRVTTDSNRELNNAAGRKQLTIEQEKQEADGPSITTLSASDPDEIISSEAAPAEARQDAADMVMQQAPLPARKKGVEKFMLSETAGNGVLAGRALEGEGSPWLPPGQYQDAGRDRFEEITRNPVKLVTKEPVSTFSVDVDTASYAFVRRQLNNGLLPQKDAVRVEEMINYFNYDYPLPEDSTQPFKPSVAVYPTPWNASTKLLHIGIKGYDIVPAEKPRSNLVFLLDVSGSMNSPDKLPLLKNAFSMLVESLDPEDTVAIAVYAGASGTALEPTKVKEKGKILAALDKLKAGGSTAGGEGIRLAYALAEMNFDKSAVNRVILATDGDFNVGITDRNELKSYIERKRATGIFLSVVGFGQGNYNDALMQTLAQNGNGNAAYIDSLNEARKVLVDEAGSTLFPIAKDVKIQIEFNPARVHDYRLIGYETRLLNREDFNNDRVDAGDIGSGHTVTAIYEFTPIESREKLIDDLRYQKTDQTPKVETTGEYAFLKLRYKLPDQDTSSLLTLPVTEELAHESVTATPQDLQFASAVAAFGQILRGGTYTGEYDYDDVLRLAEPARGRDRFGYRTEFLNLVRLAKTAKAM